VEVGLLMVAGGIAAGIFGSLLGLGGGILIVPMLTLGFGLPLREAVGVSLVSVIVTSAAAAAVYLERDVADLRLGMTLELFTATGAILGGAIAVFLPARALEGLFAALLIYVSATMLRAARRSAGRAAASAAASAATASAHSRIERVLGRREPALQRVPLGIVGSVFAGVLSALLGIGGGLVKVPVMHLVMGVPLRVATATSNLMIGITASTSAIIYLLSGGIAPFAAGPTALGVFVGASIGSRSAHRLPLGGLRIRFVAVLLYTAFEMGTRAMGGS
jgi:uncharacterized membrane protein YfcA